jgi:hypothetical protein
MIYLIEGRFDVKLDHPVILPAPLSGDSNGLLCRPSRPTQQSVAQQVRQPFCVLHIGLATRNLLDVLCVGYHDRQRSFQNRVDQLPAPVLSRAAWVQPGSAQPQSCCMKIFAEYKQFAI